MTRGGPASPASESTGGLPRPPVVLTFLAPASQCNQRCPNCYITEVKNEPVRSFDLKPRDFVRFTQQFLDAKIPILSVKFQGYEVTLPQSWPYLEAVFPLAQQHGIRRSFITNGMLLHKWVKPIREFDIQRIAVSLDGATPEVNDRSRGLDGAFAATTRSLQRFLKQAPEYRERIAIASLLRGDDSFQSLLAMPDVLRDLGVSRWIVAAELGGIEGEIRPLLPADDLMQRLPALQAAAERAGIRFFASDEYGSLPQNQDPKLTIHRVRAREFFYRMDPTGGIHIGRDIFRPWDSKQIPHWNPDRDNAVDTVKYWETAMGFGARNQEAGDRFA